MPVPSPISSVNDFVVRFANVNGSGSASANELFARAVMRMGVPVSPRNIFPSNIQGLPTWYEVRITEAGHLGARGGVDLMVAMNPQTFDKDVASIEKGGYLFYDSTKPVPASRVRDDITVIGVPLTAICNREYIDPRQRQLFKNIIYLGALSALLDMDVPSIEALIGEQFRGKDFLEASALREPDCVLLDLHMPVMSGLQVLRALQAARRTLPIVIITAHDAPEARDQCLAAGASAYLRKPLDEHVLLGTISAAVSAAVHERR